MKRKQKPAIRTSIWLEDERLAALRMQAIEVASRLPEAQPANHMGGYAGSPGKSASKVISDAEAIMAFVRTAA